MIRAAIFDLDGLLVDTEPLWRRAEIEVLMPLGVPLTEEMCRETQGSRIDAAVAHWYRRYPWKGATAEEVVHRVFDHVLDLVSAEALPMPGATSVVELFARRGVPLAVCSSSWSPLIAATLEKVGLGSVFAVRHSAQDEEHGKPHPACYLTTAAKLGVEPGDCLAIEDSFNGAIAAKAALMTVVAVPESFLRNPARWGFCDVMLDSLEDMDDEFVERILSG